MDRMIYVALNTMKGLRDDRTVIAQNLANANTPGFRRDLTPARDARFLEAFGNHQSRAFMQSTDTALFSQIPGPIQETGQSLDLAIREDGYFYISPRNGGEPALSRRGDLRLDPERQLTDGAGNRVLDPGGAPITLPSFREIAIDEAGVILIEPTAAPPGTQVIAGQIATTLAKDTPLKKSADGHIRGIDGALPEPDQRGRITQGAREASNVDTITSLVRNIETQRQFEINVRLIAVAQEIDEAGSRLLQVPGR